MATMAGFIIIPTCFAYGIEPGSGPSLIFLTIPNIFAQMPGGQLWGALFFLFLPAVQPPALPIIIRAAL